MKTFKHSNSKICEIDGHDNKQAIIGTELKTNMLREDAIANAIKEELVATTLQDELKEI
ncbi:hypothetical protein G7B40_013225 [Aetokthonos hydrillicola Thurmond2011]|uniref:Uncharacterized protein n=1 Tax=Aetokthonos hydrillicola Thurmond2011 TaxID=2712845 RepID=A0AAP5M7W3_9CYAN|nr:hypothetical protein [Aetokthonos hydrillicola]MBO3463650.1 hypothetical protein [Aetokthonos hydrillicola CCALA 1050]MBW4583785.1 hypothetical protein [Aetokthonos hydrillicola CCALA 1050]MDR9895520.1 hypothetical protein [Aetokthonos hydrillicola Thurmond2011]